MQLNRFLVGNEISSILESTFCFFFERMDEERVTDSLRIAYRKTLVVLLGSYDDELFYILEIMYVCSYTVVSAIMV